METPKQTYKVRSGTIEFGKEYEFKIAALLSLRCIQDGQDMWIALNVDGMHAFDDIILYRNGILFLLQLKQKKKTKNITKQQFFGSKGDFVLQSYWEDINKLVTDPKTKPDFIKDLDLSNAYFAIYTNQGTNQCRFLEQSDDKNVSFLNTGCNNNIHTINLSKLPEGVNVGNCYYNNFFLFSSQVSVKDIDNLIIEEIQKIQGTYPAEVIETNIKNVSEKFIKYITDWAKGTLGGHYFLTKQDILCKLTELFFCQYEINLNNENFTYYECKQKYLWNKIIRDKKVTVIYSDENVSKFLIEYLGSEVKEYCKEHLIYWSNILSQQAQNSFYQDHDKFKTLMLKIVGSYGKISLLDIYKCLWMDEKLPLLLIIKNIQDYKNILHILKLTKNCYSVIVLNKSKEPLPIQENENIIKHFCTLQDLSDEDKNEILKQGVKLQGRFPVTLKNLIDESMFQNITCANIINILTNNFNIGDELQLLPQYFIERSVTKIFLKPKVLKKVKDIFLVERYCEKYFKMIPRHNTDVCELEDINFSDPARKIRIIVSNKNVTWEKIQKLKKRYPTFHHVAISDFNNLEWRWSYGSTNSVEPFQIQLQYSILDNHVTNKFDNNITIISAEPGMGKSILMDVIANRAPANKWVLNVNLNKHHQYYRNNGYTTANIEASKHLNYFQNQASTYKCNSNLINAVFQKLVDTRNVIVLFDGFDELPISYEEDVTNIAKSLKKEGHTIWLSTRPFMKSHLERQLKTFSITLNEFSIHDQRQFLEKYFNSVNTDLIFKSETLRADFVQQLLQAAQRNLYDKDAEFTGIPLQIKLLADFFNNDYRNYICNKDFYFNDDFDLLCLCHNFIDKKLDILNEKFSCNVTDMLIMHKEHQSLFALKLLFPVHDYEMNVKKRKLRNYYKKLNYYKKNKYKLKNLQREGVITVDDKFNINFVHRTYAEYLAAVWLSQNLNNANQKVRDIVKNLVNERFKQNHTFLFNIYDRILAKDCPLHLAIINGNISAAAEIVSLDPSSVTLLDKGGRTTLHVMALHISYPPETAILNYEDLRQSKFTLRETNILWCTIRHMHENILPIVPDIFGYTALDYALENRSLIFAHELCTMIITSDIEKHIKEKFTKDFLSYSFYVDWNKFLSYFQYKDRLICRRRRSSLIKLLPIVVVAILMTMFPAFIIVLC